MLTTYHLDHPVTGDSVVLDGWSYIWAAFLGPLYVLAKGFRMLALVMVAITLGIAGAAFIVLGLMVTFFNTALGSVMAIAAIAVVALAVHATAGVELVRYGLIRKGWREGYY